MLRMSLLLDSKETFVAVGRRTGVRHILVFGNKDLAIPHSRQKLKTSQGEEVVDLGGGMYLVLPTGEILTKKSLLDS